MTSTVPTGFRTTDLEVQVAYTIEGLFDDANICHKRLGAMADDAVETLWCTDSKPMPGRYLQLQTFIQEHLHIRQVVIFGM